MFSCLVGCLVVLVCVLLFFPDCFYIFVILCNIIHVHHYEFCKTESILF